MKKFFNIFFSITLFILLLLLSFSLTSKSIVLNTMENLYTKDEIKNKILSTINEYIPNINDEKLNTIKDKIENSKEIDIITEKYFDGVLSSLLNEKIEKVDITTEYNSLITDITSNMNSYEKNFVTKYLPKEKIDSVYKEFVNNANNSMNNEFKLILKIYDLLTSNSLKKVLLFLVIINILIIFVINKSIVLSLKYIAITQILYGVMSLLLVVILSNSLSDLFIDYFGRNIDINFSLMNRYSLINLIIGIIILIISIVYKRVKKA